VKCQKCSGKMFLDRTFSDNENYEIYCMMCGVRKFISKKTGFGAWLQKVEEQRRNA
jgi:DNA-directed RNA polymerase subunit RPC12/RpoP